MQKHLPLGYKLKEGQLIIDEDQAKTVEMIFRAYLAGASMCELAKQLNEKGCLNTSDKPSWHHGALGKILENTKYLGDERYPQLIQPDSFDQVQKRRHECQQALGRSLKVDSMIQKESSIFNGKLYCGECGAVYRSYKEHGGRQSQQANWKCKNHIHDNKIACRCGIISDQQIKEAVITAINQILRKKQLLDQKPKTDPQPIDPVFQKLDQQIKSLEAQGNYNGNELADLIFKRAAVCYNTAEIKDYDYNTEKMKQAFEKVEPLQVFDKELFLTVVKQLTIYADHQLMFELINGLKVKGSY